MIRHADTFAQADATTGFWAAKYDPRIAGGLTLIFSPNDPDGESEIIVANLDAATARCLSALGRMSIEQREAMAPNLEGMAAVNEYYEDLP